MCTLMRVKPQHRGTRRRNPNRERNAPGGRRVARTATGTGPRQRVQPPAPARGQRGLESSPDFRRCRSTCSLRYVVYCGRGTRVDSADDVPQIFAQLHPHDLLRLSRTTKTIRDLLMARSARATWIQALATIPDLPPCPEDMTECAWTHLLFDSSCYNCDAKGVRSVLWCLRLRACSKCSTESK
jgi:hypothetical protein